MSIRDEVLSRTNNELACMGHAAMTEYDMGAGYLDNEVLPPRKGVAAFARTVAEMVAEDRDYNLMAA